MKTSLKYMVLSSLFTVIFSSHFVLWGQTCSTFSDLNDIYFKDDIIIYSRLHFVAEEYANRMLQFTNIDASDFESKLQQTANCFVEVSMPDIQEDRTIIFLILSSRTIAATESTSNFTTVQDFTEVSAQKASAKDWIEALPILTDDEKRELYNILFDEFKQSHSPEFIQAEQEFMGGLFSEKEGVSSQRPPKIQITTKFEKEYKQSRQEIQLVAGNGSEEVQTLEVFINDVRLQVTPSNTDYSDPFAWKYKQDFDLKIGENGEKENTLIIKCMDAAGRMACDTITIIYNPDDYMDRKDYAILFAVDDYSKVGDADPLNKPIKDAEKFAKLLTEYGFDTLIVRNPTRAIIYETLDTFAAKEYGYYDQLLIFYAGHGYTDNKGRGYIVPSDGNLKKTYELVSYSDVRDIIDINPCRHILFISDACYSGSFMKVGDYKTRGPQSTLQNEVMKHKSRLFIGSSTAKDKAPDESQLMATIFKLFKNTNNDEPINFMVLAGLINGKEGQEKTIGSFGSHEIGGNFYFNRK